MAPARPRVAIWSPTRSTADDYYLEGGTALAEFTLTDAAGEVVAERSLSPEGYAAWVDWTDP